jgi:aminoglycoside phosphotransferase (APT) family kinase protein
MANQVAELDVEALTGWLDREGHGAGPLQTRYLSGGSQNDIWVLTRGDWDAVIRIPPPSAPIDRDAGILREWRIIAALDGTDVPHTKAVAVCEDTSVLGRTFYLMGLVDGWSPMDNVDGRWPEPYAGDASARSGLAHALIDGIAELSKVDWQARGLGDLGRPDGYHERQVQRWTRFLDRSKGREIPGLAEATRWLEGHRPIDFVPGIMHGDYQFANVMFKHGIPVEMAAIVDWEMGTVGDPKLDLAWVVQSWPEDTSEQEGLGYVDITGMPSRSALIERWATLAGRQVDDMDYYVILAKWKIAIVLEQGFQRAREDDDKMQAFGPIVLTMMQEAADLAESSDYR